MLRYTRAKNSRRRNMTGRSSLSRSRQLTPVGPQVDILTLQHTAGNRTVNELLRSNANNKPHAVDHAPPIVEPALKHGGQILDPASREAMEPLFGEDFSQVRVHTDNEAAESARAVDALAYTAGQDIVFGTGQCRPETDEGRRLLAHELGHVAEQREAGLASLTATQSSPTTIMRAPIPGAGEHLSLFASRIPAPTVTRFGSIIIATFYFGQNFFLFDSRNLEAVEKLGDELRLMMDPVIAVDGYASREDAAQHNLELSEKRRQSVIAILRSKVISNTIFSGKAHGESRLWPCLPWRPSPLPKNRKNRLTSFNASKPRRKRKKNGRRVRKGNENAN